MNFEIRGAWRFDARIRKYSSMLTLTPCELIAIEIKAVNHLFFCAEVPERRDCKT